MQIHSAGKGGSLAAAARTAPAAGASSAAAKPKADAAKGDAQAAEVAAPQVQPLLVSLFTSANAEEASGAANSLASYVNDHGLRVLDSEQVAEALVLASNNKKSASERESAAIAFQTIAYHCGGKNARPFALGAEPWLMDLLPPTLDLYADKSDSVREAAEGAASALLALIPPEGAVDVLGRLYAILKDGAPKWQTKVGTLKAISRLSEADSEQIGEVLEDLIPVLTHSMHETKGEVRVITLKPTYG